MKGKGSSEVRGEGLCRNSDRFGWIMPKPSRKEFMQSQLVCKKVVEEKDKENLQ